MSAISGLNRLVYNRISSCFCRNTCKIAVEVEQSIAERLNNKEIKSRQQPGIIKKGFVTLPEHIQRALIRAVGDRPIKAVVKDAANLNKYLQARHPPSEEKDLNLKMQNVLMEVNKKLPTEHFSVLSSEIEQEKYKNKREQLIKCLMGQRTYAWKQISYGDYEALVYAIGRGAHDYSVLCHIFTELQSRDKHFQPNSYFDFGSGVGTGMWAASAFWKNSIHEYFNVDSSREMSDFSELILREGTPNGTMMLRNVYYRQFLPSIETKYDLVVSSFSLFEMPSLEARLSVIDKLWKKTDKYLVIIEEGSRRGTEMVNEARSFVLEQNKYSNDLKGYVFAPCPHDLVCPRISNLEDRTPCNFETSYSPLRVGDVRGDKNTARYSYVVLKKGDRNDDPMASSWPRLVRPTLNRSKHIVCRMCTENAKLQEIIFTKAKHKGNAYNCAKVSRWGDRLPIKIGESFDKQTKENAAEPEVEK